MERDDITQVNKNKPIESFKESIPFERRCFLNGVLSVFDITQS